MVTPEPSASGICVGEMRWTWQSTPPAVRIMPLPATISVDGPITSSGCTPSIVSGLPALPSATIRPSRTPTSALTTPQWSSTTRAGDHQVRRALGAGGPGLAHRLADDLAAAEDDLVAALRAAAAVLGDLDEQVGVGEPDPVADGRPVQLGVAGAVDLIHGHGCPTSVSRSPGTVFVPPSSTSSTVFSTPGSKRTAVPAGTASRLPCAASRSNSSAGLAAAKW